MNKLVVIFLLIATFGASAPASAAPLCHVMLHNSQASPYATEITVIIGTDRKDSNSSKIANQIVLELAQYQNTKINVVNLSELPPSIFKSDYFAKKSRNFEMNFADPIERSRGLIFVIPEYDGAVPGILSYYMNHLRINFEKKQVALIGLAAGKWGARQALDSFKGTLTHRRARVLGDLQVNIENVESKIEGNKLNHQDSIRRLKESTHELVKSLDSTAESIASQKIVALISAGLFNKNVELSLNNRNSVQGKLSNYVLNANGTLAYVQFAGPTKIKNEGVVIEGQDVNVHNLGYGMPVGAVRGFKSEWYKKENLVAAKLIVGKHIKLEYTSGILVDGQIKKLTFDSKGNLLVVTFNNVVVKNGADVLFQKEWGDFDIAVGDYIENINPN